MLSKNQNSLQCLKRPNLSLSNWTVAHLFSVPPLAIRASHHLHTSGALLRCYCLSEALPGYPVWTCTMFYFLLFPSCCLWTVSFICFIACLLPLRTSVAQEQGFLSLLFIVTSLSSRNRAWHIPRPSVTSVEMNKWSFRTWNRVME